MWSKMVPIKTTICSSKNNPSYRSINGSKKFLVTENMQSKFKKSWYHQIHTDPQNKVTKQIKRRNFFPRSTTHRFSFLFPYALYGTLNGTIKKNLSYNKHAFIWLCWHKNKYNGFWMTGIKKKPNQQSLHRNLVKGIVHVKMKNRIQRLNKNIKKYILTLALPALKLPAVSPISVYFPFCTWHIIAAASH